jgi:lambda family phage portal protein
MDRWKRWGETTECDAAGRLTFYGLQRLVMRSVVESGEVLIRRRLRRPEDGLAIPMQLEVLEADYIDTGKDGFLGIEGGPVIQGVEFDAIGRRVAYWLYEQHPGSSGPFVSATSRRVSASGILHVYDQDRPGQMRGPSWFAPIDVRLHDFDEFEDATHMKQKIAACMAAFVTDLDGSGTALVEAGTDPATEKPLDMLEPGAILNLPVGKQVTVANPPQATDHQSYSQTALRGIAAGLGVTYEDLTGDYSQVNFSSARMARIAHMGDLHDWRWNMLIPQFCAPAWTWMLMTLDLIGVAVDLEAPATWTPPPAPMIDPNTEGQALMRMLRTGAMTHDQMVSEQGYDPDDFWEEYADGLERLDKLKIILDSDPRKTTGAGQAQTPPAKPGANGLAAPNGAAKPNGAAPTAEEN